MEGRREQTYKKWVVTSGKFFLKDDFRKEFYSSRSALTWLKTNGYKFYDVYGEYVHEDKCRSARLRMEG